MLVTISGLVGRAPQCLFGDRAMLEAALAVPTGDGKDWFAVRFSNAFVDAAQVIRKGDTISVTGELTFEPMPDGSIALFKPVVAVSDLQLCDAPIAY
ncbi:single-stranded DNA-binding protein [Chamaesiphon polymorphus]|uniref:Single-stranded DNA-binding protein n=1 Tax=Chamaesiphon polymorphus CCALA 037 TaxID=2107692 RepID=A0A2T1FR44_9CYAN|nr:single-stranded DNA-binding protein [Chamaesiphon polymorphus]PSB47463.1 single-stranded DNA-binding protein [Chamaesiphon polymorphus CCALA 037]